MAVVSSDIQSGKRIFQQHQQIYGYRGLERDLADRLPAGNNDWPSDRRPLLQRGQVCTQRREACVPQFLAIFSDQLENGQSSDVALLSSRPFSLLGTWNDADDGLGWG